MNSVLIVLIISITIIIVLKMVIDLFKFIIRNKNNKCKNVDCGKHSKFSIKDIQ